MNAYRAQRFRSALAASLVTLMGAGLERVHAQDKKAGSKDEPKLGWSDLEYCVAAIQPKVSTTDVSRRSFLFATTAGLLTYGLVNTLLSRDLLAPARPGKLDDWIDALYALGGRLERGEITGKAWQAGIDALYRRADIPALLAHLDFDKVKKSIDLTANGEAFVTTPLRADPNKPYIPTAPEGTGVITKLAGTRKGSAVPPHAHQNMVSAFLIVSGEYHVVQYDKLGSEGVLRPGAGSLIIREVQNVRQQRGQWSSISDDRSNLHWLRATSDGCYFLSCKLMMLKPNVETHGRINVDVRNADDLGGGTLKCPIISFERAAELFG
jgi:hypothetical protein